MNYLRFVALSIVLYIFPLYADDAIEVDSTVAATPSYLVPVIISFATLMALVSTFLFFYNGKSL